jgi:Tat protein secretion system quality control protein TatD with DNase activity
LTTLDASGYLTAAARLESIEEQLRAKWQDIESFVGIGEGGLDPEYEHDMWVYAHRTDVFWVMVEMGQLATSARMVADALKRLDDAFAEGFDSD